ncbi:MAG: TetR/AcrR family transcriptional regulator [Thermodesulfovibrionales bacterium]|nr:TetR/AcrR family transcriptional regulator [Thermodesulfovibrionales bacterium]
MTLQSLSTKDKILESAIKLFSQKGYLGASTRQIAKEAGVAEITLFRHFSTKEKLLEEVLNKYSFLPHLRTILPEVLNLEYEDALFLIVKNFLNSLFLRKDLIKIMKAEIFTHPDKVAKHLQVFIDELYDTIALYFQEMQTRGILRDFDTRLAGRALLGMVFTYFEVEEYIFQKQNTIEDYEEAIKEFVKIFVKGTVK